MSWGWFSQMTLNAESVQVGWNTDIEWTCILLPNMSEQSGTLTSNLIWKIFLIRDLCCCWCCCCCLFQMWAFLFFSVSGLSLFKKKKLIDSEILFAYLVNSPNTAEDSFQQQKLKFFSYFSFLTCGWNRKQHKEIFIKYCSLFFTPPPFYLVSHNCCCSPPLCVGLYVHHPQW